MCLFTSHNQWIEMHVVISPGFTEENVDEIKETLVGSNLYLLVLTALITALQVRSCNTMRKTMPYILDPPDFQYIKFQYVSFRRARLLQMKHCKVKVGFYLQLICEFLALKNDFCSWRKKKTMAGMSRKSGKRCF